jgi:2-iminobutanoate/2-iminopropanoate deaminase
MVHGEGMCVAVEANGWLFVSALRGHPPGRPDELADDTGQQARQAFENLRLVLEDVGATFTDVVKVTLYLHDLGYRDAFHAVWREYFPEDPPARIAVQVADANTRPGRNAHFALDVIALVPDRSHP